MKMVKLSERQWAVVHGFIGTALGTAVAVTANTAYAQSIDLAWLDFSSNTIKAIVGHSLFGTILFGAFCWELLQFATTKRIAHFIGMVVPGICTAAWVSRSSLFQAASGWAPGQ